MTLGEPTVGGRLQAGTQWAFGPLWACLDLRSGPACSKCSVYGMRCLAQWVKVWAASRGLGSDTCQLCDLQQERFPAHPLL